MCSLIASHFAAQQAFPRPVCRNHKNLWYSSKHNLYLLEYFILKASILKAGTLDVFRGRLEKNVTNCWLEFLLYTLIKMLNEFTIGFRNLRISKNTSHGKPALFIAYVHTYMSEWSNESLKKFQKILWNHS